MNLQNAQCVTNERPYHKLMKVINLIGSRIFFISLPYLNSLNYIYLELFLRMYLQL